MGKAWLPDWKIAPPAWVGVSCVLIVLFNHNISFSNTDSASKMSGSTAYTMCENEITRASFTNEVIYFSSTFSMACETNDCEHFFNFLTLYANVQFLYNSSFCATRLHCDFNVRLYNTIFELNPTNKILLFKF